MAQIIQICAAYRRGYVLCNVSLSDFVVVRRCTHPKLDSITHYTPRLYGIVYSS